MTNTVLDISLICQAEPNIVDICVYSDWLEDMHRFPEANALRWLLKWDHWPYYNKYRQSEMVTWWASVSYEKSRLSYCRYGACHYPDSLKRRGDMAYRCSRASLPPEYVLLIGENQEMSFKSIQESLEWFMRAYQEVGNITPTIWSKEAEDAKR